MGKRKVIIDGEVKLVAHKDLVNTPVAKPSKSSKKVTKESHFDDPDNHDYSETVLVESDPILTEDTHNNEDQDNLKED